MKNHLLARVKGYDDRKQVMACYLNRLTCHGIR